MNRKAQTFFRSDRRNQFCGDGYVLARHYHFLSFFQSNRVGYVGGPEVELGTLVGEEQGIASALFFAQYVHFCFELGVRCDSYPVWPIPDHALRLHVWYRAAIRLRCRLPDLRPAVCGTFQHWYRWFLRFFQTDDFDRHRRG